MGLKLGELFYDLLIKKGQFDADIDSAKRQVDSFETKMKNAGASLQSTL